MSSTKLPFRDTWRRRKTDGPSSRVSTFPPVVVAVKEMVALFTSKRDEESASTNWTIEPGAAVVPVCVGTPYVFT
jgi:hypothetical protein